MKCQKSSTFLKMKRVFYFTTIRMMVIKLQQRSHRRSMRHLSFPFPGVGVLTESNLKNALSKDCQNG